MIYEYKTYEDAVQVLLREMIEFEIKQNVEGADIPTLKLMSNTMKTCADFLQSAKKENTQE